ncbi:hypothetical protein DICPUDRAFT_83380 [Dictyostelium purpureum]|uniref:Uncharacterized protein n=1 Tax=Dictyostelium purpureum TaxID=5786 RepID=F0ZZD1_DICPU|nr:uncharacterized protein DICPUDRAFT_83380 [Dictyostelium purpureum]EGC30712.1 hypothetical protein DICPUDRAFT_83380 [Dictyostelium purpureum]|eukprot:XP_003292775.1 hypothetical protein DICPUDRAFT_83380 [Dictyostelium purpureum]
MHVIKNSLQISVSTISQKFCKKESFNLCVRPGIADHLSYEELKEIYDKLTLEDKHVVETIYWELMKKEDSRIDGWEYGKINFFNNLRITARSLHRGGFIELEDKDSLIKIDYTTKLCRTNNSSKTQYFSLGEKYGNNLSIGYCGYVNGMGNTIGWAGRDASIISDTVLDGIDLHCVYLPSYQHSPDGFSPSNDFIGFSMDVARHLSINGGDYSKTACLIAQQWIDYLTDNPDKYFLTIAASDGGTFTCAAVKLMCQYCPHLLSRVSIILLAPGCFLFPNEYIKYDQVMNFVKLEDNLITRLATGSQFIGKHQNIIIVPHNSTSDHPHNFLSYDFAQIVKPYVEQFKKTGKLINDNNNL